MNLEDMSPLRQAFNLDQDDAMFEDDNNQLREQGPPFGKMGTYLLFSGTLVLCETEEVYHLPSHTKCFVRMVPKASLCCHVYFAIHHGFALASRL